ncbi:unnamed protein product [Medioppia subpectinata]|uniref:Cytochrome P450 n=1 Tax=Medioppia subpectinata TaxID=1979941 RepID=A0A7R9L433_9ACAR|nr:unnamed protein product [Medioppia subpectinata]CAG2115039.1 unnamed protein product [Medioppia subpectinata]
MWIYARDLYENHVKTYDKNNLRDFCDTIIAAKHEAIADNKPSAKYLTDENLITTMCGLINAGVETTQDTVLWILLYIAYYPDYQQKLRNEISREIGDRKSFWLKFVRIFPLCRIGHNVNLMHQYLGVFWYRVLA